MSETEIKDDFFMNVLIDYGYVRMNNGWEIVDVDEDSEKITFQRGEE